MLWECPVHDCSRNSLMRELHNLHVRGKFSTLHTCNKFCTLHTCNRADFILGCENWDRYDFTHWLRNIILCS